MTQCGDPECACVTYPMLHGIRLNGDEPTTLLLTANPSAEMPASRPSEAWLPVPALPRTVHLRREGKRFVIVD